VTYNDWFGAYEGIFVVTADPGAAFEAMIVAVPFGETDS